MKRASAARRVHTVAPALFAWWLACLGSAVVAARADDWPQWRYDAQRSAASPEKLPAEMHLQWVRQLPTPQPAWPASQPGLRFDVSYSPVAAGKLLFVPSMVTDSVTAYDTQTGEERWRFHAQGPVRFAPIAYRGGVYAASDDGFLYCVDARDGTLRWKYQGAPADRKVLGNERLISSWPIRGAPVLHGGKIYFGASVWCFMGVFVHSVDAETGEAAWVNSGDGANYKPQPHGGAVAFGDFIPNGYFGIRDDRLVAPGGRTTPAYYDLKTGKLLEFKWDNKGNQAWQVYGDLLRIRAGGQDVQAKGGQVTVGSWQGSYEGEPWSLLTADGKLFVVTTAGSIYCFGAKTGAPAKYATADPARGLALGAAPYPAGSAPSGLSRRVADAGDKSGYAVIFGISSVEQFAALVRDSQLHVIVVESDRSKVDALRRWATDAGVYGRRIAAMASQPLDCSLPPYLANVAVWNQPLPEDPQEQLAAVKCLFHCLRPYGGTAIVPMPSAVLQALVADAKLANAVAKPLDGGSQLIREGALPGAADWTHNYADAANSIVSQDQLVRAPLGVLWFGNGPPNDEVLPRHGHGPSPQVAHGRLFIEGAEMLRCLDVYTGRLLWQRQFKSLGKFYDNTKHQPGANEIGSNYVSLADSVYLAYGEKILRLDPATGETLREITWQAPGEESPRRWGFLAVCDNFLVSSAVPVDATAEGFRSLDYASASKHLVVMDRQTGGVLWSRTAKYSYRHNNIAASSEKVFCIDGVSPAQLDLLRRRGEDPRRAKGSAPDSYRPELLALDIRSGKVLWKLDKDVFGTFLNYSAEQDILLQAGSANRDRAKDEINQGMMAIRGRDGTALWKDLNRSHGGPCALFHDMILAQGPAFSLLTGERLTRKHPLSGTPIEWAFTRTYGCNTAVASQQLITFRSGAAGFFDLANDGGTGNLGGFKSGCTSNLIVANGVLSAPEYTRTCVCNYQNQTSLALVHDPSVELWTFNEMLWDRKPVRRVGINLGAPGDRRSASGTLWLDYPSVGGKSPDLPITIEPKDAATFRAHSALVRGASGAGEAWIAASGIEGLRRLTLDLARGETSPRSYTVRLCFSEPSNAKPGERVFSVSLQDREVLPRLDIVQEAGAHAALVREFRDVSVVDRLTITLTPAGDSSQRPPLLCGIEAVMEDR